MSQAQSLRPAPGTKTRRVWELADQRARLGRVKRAEIIEAFVAEGGNANTASTQFQYWKREHERSSEMLSSEAARVSLEVKDGGRILLPADIRAALGVRAGDTLRGEVVDGQLRLMSRATAIRKAQEMVRRHLPEGTSLVDQLIADRRAEFRRETGQ